MNIYGALAKLISPCISFMDSPNNIIALEEEEIKKLLFALLFAMDEITAKFGLTNNPFFELSETNIIQMEIVTTDYEKYQIVFQQWDKILGEIKSCKIDDIDTTWFQIKDMITNELIILNQILLSNEIFKNESGIISFRKYISCHKQLNKFFPELNMINKQLNEEVEKINGKLIDEKNKLNILNTERNNLVSYVERIKTIY